MSSILKEVNFLSAFFPNTNPDSCEYSFLPQASNINLFFPEPISSGYFFSSALSNDPSLRLIDIFQLLESIS